MREQNKQKKNDHFKANICTFRVHAYIVISCFGGVGVCNSMEVEGGKIMSNGEIYAN